MYQLTCPDCKTVLARITTEELFSDRYLQGDEPIWCQTCGEDDDELDPKNTSLHYVFPLVDKMETMGERYDDRNNDGTPDDHLCCPICGLCIICGDCNCKKQ